MKKLAIFLLTASALICATNSLMARPFAQPAAASPTATPAPAPNPSPESASPSPTATPAKEKGKFLGIFGRKSAPAASSEVAETPQPTPAAPQVEKEKKADSSKPVMKAIPVSSPATPATSPTPVPDPTPEATPKTKKRSFFKFGGTPKPETPEATPPPTTALSPAPAEVAPKPEPTPAATPKPTPTPKPKSSVTTKKIKAPTPAPTPKPKPSPTPSQTDKPESAEKTLNTSAIPFVPEQTSKPKVTDGAKESQRYKEVKAQAIEDKTILALRSKADIAPEGEEFSRASRAYYQALFTQMRKLDPSISDYIDRVEAATLRRLQQ